MGSYARTTVRTRAELDRPRDTRVSLEPVSLQQLVVRTTQAERAHHSPDSSTATAVDGKVLQS